MSDIILKDQNGNNVTYTDITEIKMKKSGGGTVTYTEGGGGTSIVGATEITATASEALSQGDTVKVITQPGGFQKLDCATAEGGYSPFKNTYSPDGTKLFVQFMTNPGGIYVYNTTTNPYTVEYSFQPSSGYAQCMAVNPSGTILALGITASPYIKLYDITSIPYTELQSPSTLPGNNVIGLSFNPDGTRLCVGVVNVQDFIIYNTSTIPYDQVPSPMLDIEAYSFTYVNSNRVLVIRQGEYPVLFDCSREPWQVASELSTLTDTSCRGAASNRAGTRLTIASSTSPYLRIYDTTTSPYTLLQNPEIIPSSCIDGCSFSFDGTTLVLYSNMSSPKKLFLYDTTSSPYTKLNDVDAELGDISDCKFSPTELKFYTTGSDGNPCFYMYGGSVAGTFASKANNIISQLSGSYGYAKDAIAANAQGTIVKIFNT